MILHDRHSEEMLLAWFLLDPHNLDKARKEFPKLTADFFTDKRADLFEALEAVYDATNCDEFDYQLLENFAQANNGDFDQVYISILLDQIDDVMRYSSEPLFTYGKKVYELGKKRQLSEFGYSLANTAQKDGLTAEEAFAAANTQVNAFFNSDITESNLFTEAHKSFNERLHELATHGADHVTPTGFDALDNKISGGFKDASLNVIAARSGTGKTAFMLQVMESMLMNQQNRKPAVFISLEMSTNELIDRILCNCAQDNLNNIINGRLKPWQHQSLAGSLTKMFTRDGKDFKSLYISERGGLTIEELQLQLSNLNKKTGGLSAVFIDYLGLIKTKRNYENRALQIGMITHSLLDIGKELNCPIVLAVQLNRQIEQAKEHDVIPKNSYLRESGDIENDADIIMMLTQGKRNNEDNYQEIKLHITKNRSGSQTGDQPIVFHFYGSKFTFKEEYEDNASKYIPPEPKNFYGGQPDM